MKSTYFALSLFLSASSLSVYAQKAESRTRPVVPYPQAKLAAPPGMVYVPGGTTIIKYSQQANDSNCVKKVSLSSFFIDRTEVTNQQYRQFVEWVVDSIAITKYLKDEDKFFKDKPAEPTQTAEVKTTDSAAANAPAATAQVPANTAAPQRRINWARVNHQDLFSSDEYREKLRPMLDEKGQVKKDSIMYTYAYLRSAGTNQKVKPGTWGYLGVNVYPDQEIWAKDFPNAQTDILVENYFTSEPYDDYPVVGVTWQQANAFTYWRSHNASSYDNVADYMKSYHLAYSLPSEAQWVYAAQMDMRALTAMVPANKPEEVKEEPKKEEKKSKKSKKEKKEETAATTDAAAPATPPTNPDDPNSVWSASAANPTLKADSLAFYDPQVADEMNTVPSDKRGLGANFKQDEGDLTSDGSAFTVPVMSYAPNSFGIYNMIGNVAEWTKDAYSPSAFAFVSDVNPVLLYDADSTDSDPMKRKVVRGGSFNSPAKELSPYYRAYEMQQTAHSYIGFRCVMAAPEILGKAVATRKKSKRK